MMQLAQSGMTTIIVLGMLALVIAWLLLRSHRYFSRQRADRSTIVKTRRPVRKDPGHHLDAPDDVRRWEVQMHETARDLMAQLDSKLSALRALILEADRAAERLERAAASADAASAAATSADVARQSLPPDPRLSDRAEALKSPPPQAAAGDLPESPSAEGRREEIYALADRGLDAAEIAPQIDMPVGEVALILGLRETL